MSSADQSKKILFVCLGNICRSPAAEATFLGLIEREGIATQFFVESAGTGGWHIGELPDSRMRKQGEKRGLRFETRARQIKRPDLDTFDFIVVMDDSNLRDVAALAADDAQKSKILRMASFHSSGSLDIIPDPYYGGIDGFDLVLDLLDDCCRNLLVKIR